MPLYYLFVVIIAQVADAGSSLYNLLANREVVTDAPTAALGL